MSGYSARRPESGQTASHPKTVIASFGLSPMPRSERRSSGFVLLCYRSGSSVSSGHVGNNLNQMTHHTNRTGDVPSQKVLKEIGDAIIAALKKVRDL